MNNLTFLEVARIGLIVLCSIVCYDAIKALRNLRIRSKDERKEMLRQLHEESHENVKNFEPEWRKKR